MSLSQHLNPDPDAAPSALPADHAWLRMSAALSAHIPPIAGREDLLVVIEPGAGGGAPACFIRERATIEINGAYLSVDPRTVDPYDPDAREEYPVAWGLLVHEAAHSRHSRWQFGTGPARAAEAAMLLEESRIEAAQLRRRPGDRRWLRATVTTILLDDIPTTDDPWAAAASAALVLGRVDAGVIDPDEAEQLRKAVTRILRPPLLDHLTQIWCDAHQVPDDDTDAMLDLGRRWCRALGVDPDATPPAPGQAGDGSTGQSGAGSAAGGGALRRAATGVVGAVASHDAEAARAAAAAAARSAQRAQQRKAEVDQQKRSQDAAATVFGGGSSGGGGGGGASTSGSPLVRKRPPTHQTRPPTDDERAAARQLARALRQAAYREPTPTVTTSVTPPGRLVTRAALAADAQRAAGQIPTSEPWRRTERRRAPQPPIHVGIVADVSPSVSAFARPIASAAWITAQATAWAGGTSATVTFGRYVTAVTRPGQPPEKVRLFAKEEDTQGFPLAVDSLDAALDLADPRGGARLLVIVSDGEFTATEIAEGRARLDRLVRAGCGMLWLGPPDSRPLGGAATTVLGNPADAGRLIARAATAALRNT
ncbi:VWA domain-containing protein [Micromonospora sp. DT233]|uniref:VWA domain-containing protein n=1 Tax=Micromonospora sp. DT233 TaxID=3393432 RepID=UPI003CE7DBAD